MPNKEDFLRVKKLSELLCYLDTGQKQYEAVWQCISVDHAGEIRIYQRDKYGNLDIAHSMRDAKELLLKRSMAMMEILLQTVSFLMDDGATVKNEAPADV